MQYISTELQRIATDLEVDYLRSASLEDANVQFHYRNFVKPTILYVGFGEAVNVNPYASEGYSEPLSAVTTTIYILVKKATVDALAETIDIQLVESAKIASQIAKRFTQPQTALSYKMSPVGEFDDMLIGYKMEIVLTIPQYGC